jgi:hypothetical protein
MSQRVHTSSPPVPKYVWALFVAWARAKILKDHFEKARRRYERLAAKNRRESQPADFAEGLKVVTFLELWLAALQVVVEGYEKSYTRPDSILSDPAVDQLLDKEHRKTLRRFRNTVFHVELRDHPDATTVLSSYKEYIDWGARLMKELGRVVVARGRAQLGSGAA